MAWYGKYEEDTDKEVLIKKIEKLEKDKRERDRLENLSLTNSYVSDDGED